MSYGVEEYLREDGTSPYEERTKSQPEKEIE